MLWITKWILLFVCYFGDIHAQNTTIYFNSSSESITIGSQFNLTCNIESTERHILDYGVHIQRNGVTICRYKHISRFRCEDEIYYRPSYFSPYGEPYNCRCVYVNSRNIIYNITIKKTRKEDNGTWVCDTLTISETLSVVVKYPPSINSIKTEPNKEEIKEGSTFKLSCLVDSYPQSNITWTSNGVQLKNDGTDFVMINATCEEYSKYTCWADNGVRSKASKTEQIDVNCSPRINLKEKPETLISASSADSVNLTVTVMAYPAPTFTWKYFLEDKSEKPITDWRIKMTSYELTSYLNIVNITEQDFGNYIMYAKNKEGNISVIFTLKKADTVIQNCYGNSSDNKLGTGIGIGFIVGLLVMGVIVLVAFLIWKKRNGTGINIRKFMMQHKKKSPTRETSATKSAPSARQTSSTQPTNQTYEDLDMKKSSKQTYEELNIYENQGVVLG